MKRTLVALAVMSLAGCSSTEAPAGPRLKKMEASKDVVAMVQGWVGQHFQLDGLPPDSRTLETAFVYISTRSHSDIILQAFKGCTTVYGAEMTVEDLGAKGTAFLYASQADFGGTRVYCLSHQWHVYQGK